MKKQPPKTVTISTAIENMLDIERHLHYLTNTIRAVGREEPRSASLLENVEQTAARLHAVGGFGTTEQHRVMLSAGAGSVIASAMQLAAAIALLPSYVQVDEEARAALASYQTHQPKTVRDGT